jgi:mono/diheme cytochrome c family protein
MDMTTNKIVWRYRWPEQCYSGMLATGGGLVFVGRNDGRLTAVDSSTGKQLWEFQTGAGMHAPVSTFLHGGKQYVLAYSAGNALIGSARGDSVWLFGLGGTVSPVEPGIPVSRLAAELPASPAPGAPAAVLTLAAADRLNGKQAFERTCVICHGDDGLGGHGGGAPLNEVRGFGPVVEVVTAGRNNMPGFAALLTPAEIRDIAAYVVETFGAE